MNELDMSKRIAESLGVAWDNVRYTCHKNGVESHAVSSVIWHTQEYGYDVLLQAAKISAARYGWRGIMFAVRYYREHGTFAGVIPALEENIESACRYEQKCARIIVRMKRAIHLLSMYDNHPDNDTSNIYTDAASVYRWGSVLTND